MPPTPAPAAPPTLPTPPWPSSRRAYEQTSQLNKDLFDLWTTSVEAGLQSALDIQNATLATYQANLRLVQDVAAK